MSIETFPLGDSAILIQLDTKISSNIHRQITALTDCIEINPFPGFIECVPAYTSVTVFYNPLLVYKHIKKENQFIQNSDISITPYQFVKHKISEIIQQTKDLTNYIPRIVEIPVCYGGNLGPDLEFVANHNKLSVDDVVEIHSSGQYLVYMIGFAPGFPYLGGMSEKIAAPRQTSPRLRIPAGSVGIAGLQTGVYPISTPGGWQLIGQTPIKLFRPYDPSPSLLQSGDIVKFAPITLEEYKIYKEKSK